MIRRFAVLDANGVKLNTIVADENLINSNWYPGYGAYLVDEGANPVDPPKAPPVPKPETWQILPALAKPMATGDKLDVKTGVVTPKPVEIATIAVEDKI